MRIRQPQQPRRSGFTLVELVTVIAIIAILVSLITAAVFKVLTKVEDTNAGNEMNQFRTGLSGFHQKFRHYPPSYVLLANSKAAYNQLAIDDGFNALRAESLKYLTALWPSIDLDTVDWSGGAAGFTAAVLEGDQCLVFFLAGMQYPFGSGMGGTGFSNNPANPTQPGGTRVGPFLENLEPGRLVATRSGNPFPSYMDAYRSVGSSPQPYFYFSAGLRKNGYPDGDAGAASAYPIHPFVQTNGQYFNQDTYQIICAGRDQQFGPGGTWSASDAETYAKNNPKGTDDLTNFHDRIMGVSK